MARLLDNRELYSDVVKTVLSGRASEDSAAGGSPLAEDYRARLQEQLAQLGRLEACGVELLGQLPNEKWKQAVGMLYLEDNRSETVASVMGYSKRSVYAFAEKAFAWIDENGSLEEVARRHFPECGPADLGD